MSYVMHECKECGYKDIFVNGRSDGKRCTRCNGRMFFAIDVGSKQELIDKHGSIYPRWNKKGY